MKRLKIPRFITKTWDVSHISSNIDSLSNGFELRKLGISFARDGKERPYSSPTVYDANGKRGLVKAKVNGSGLDYEIKAHKIYIQTLYERLDDSIRSRDVAVINTLRNLGVDWVAGWNGIGQSDELHVINPLKIQIVSIEPL